MLFLPWQILKDQSTKLENIGIPAVTLSDIRGEMNAWQTNPKGRLRGGYFAPEGIFAQKAKSREGTLVPRAYIKESTYSWNI